MRALNKGQSFFFVPHEIKTAGYFYVRLCLQTFVVVSVEKGSGQHFKIPLCTLGDVASAQRGSLLSFHVVFEVQRPFCDCFLCPDLYFGLLLISLTTAASGAVLLLLTVTPQPPPPKPTPTHSHTLNATILLTQSGSYPQRL